MGMEKSTLSFLSFCSILIGFVGHAYVLFLSLKTTYFVMHKYKYTSRGFSEPQTLHA